MEELIDFYRFEIVSSEYRYKKKVIFANRLSAFNLWKVADFNKQGYLSFSQFSDLLETSAFETPRNVEELISECETTFEFIPKEISLNANENVYRFRLFENLFLERCALH